MDIIRTLYYIQGALGDEIIFAVLLCVTLLWTLHIVIKQQFFLHYIRHRPIRRQHTKTSVSYTWLYAVLTRKALIQLHNYRPCHCRPLELSRFSSFSKKKTLALKQPVAPMSMPVFCQRGGMHGTCRLRAANPTPIPFPLLPPLPSLPLASLPSRHLPPVTFPSLPSP